MAERDTAATPAPVKVESALVLQAEVAGGAKLPQAIQAAIVAARRTGCSVQFRWLKEDITVTAGDTYQGVQRRVQRALNPDKKR